MKYTVNWAVEVEAKDEVEAVMIARQMQLTKDRDGTFEAFCSEGLFTDDDSDTIHIIDQEELNDEGKYKH